MRVLIILFICIAAAFGDNSKSLESKVDNLLRIASNDCVREMNKDPSLIVESGSPSRDPRLVEDPTFTLCLDKKMGVLTEDGTYSLERILSYSETPEIKKRVEDIYNTRIRDCTKLHGGKNTCKLVACVHRLELVAVCDGTPIEDLLKENGNDN